MAERPLNYRLLDILNEIERCRLWLADVKREVFLEDARTQYAVERALQIISEASRFIPTEMRAANPGVRWRAIADFGNLSRHGYHEVEPGLIFSTATEELGPLKAACDQLYAEVKRPSDPWPDASGK